MELSSTLLDLIRCPVSGDKLVYDKKRSVLISQQAGLAYPVRDGIPMLLESEAIPLKKSTQSAEPEEQFAKKKDNARKETAA